MYDDMPATMQRLPRDKHGRPVPWFVAIIGGQPDFRIIETGKVSEAVKVGRCWVCGWPFRTGEDRAWVVGPMCTINRVSAEPPSHLACGTWSARNCPFLTHPDMVRREKHIPDGVGDPPGNMLKRNPGVTCVWVTGYRAWKREEGLFRMGDPRQVLWFCQGREATRAEVEKSFETGFPALAGIAEQQGGEATAELGRMLKTARTYIPAT